MKMRTHVACEVVVALLACGAGLAWADAGPVYKCPGPSGVVEYTNGISAQQAKDRGCTTIEGTPITVVSTSKPRPAGENTRSTEGKKVDASEQRARDSDARKILEAELRREQAQLAELQKEYNAGEPDRRGDERNYQRYLDRVEVLKAAIDRKQSDIAALQRELATRPPAAN
jgi:hypothetical protein